MKNDIHQLLERHFDIAFAASDGIKNLRELILTLAMQGKLVTQDSKDPPASKLLKEIEVEKRRKVKEGKIKKPKTLPEIKPEEVPYELPDSWEWVRLGELGILQTGTTPPSKDRRNYGQHIPFIGPGAIKSGAIDYSGEGLSEHGLTKGRLIESNSVLMVCIGGSIGKHAINDRDITCNQQINTLTPYRPIPIKFVYWMMATISFQKNLMSQAGGSATPIINKHKWSSIPIPLPPLREQRRIVTRVDQLKARCDELEKLHTEREQLRLSVHTAAIQQLLDVEAQDGHTRAWQFLTQHFDDLYTIKENVAELRKAILQLAVIGKLVPQDPNDPPANELLKEIEAEKQRLIKEGKIKKPKPLPEIKPEDKPYELPPGWEWVQFEDVVDIGSGVTKGRKLAGKSVISIPYLRVANVQRGFLDLDEIKEIEIADYEVDKYRLRFGDLLITEGGDWDKVGRTCIWQEEISLCVHQNHIFRARKILSEQNEAWLEKYLNSPIARIYFAGASKQTTNLASINKTQLRGCPVPIPPLPEQQRIVVKINKLNALCDTLEQQIESANGKKAKLLNSVMAQI